MVAGNGIGLGRTSDVPRFDDQDFDRWIFFMKYFFIKFDRADLALTESMPAREMNGDLGDADLERAYQKKRQK